MSTQERREEEEPQEKLNRYEIRTRMGPPLLSCVDRREEEEPYG
jgi:hypothetical protein